MDTTIELFTPVEALLTANSLVCHTAWLALGDTDPLVSNGKRCTVITLPLGIVFVFGELLMEHVFYHHVIGTNIISGALVTHFKTVAGTKDKTVNGNIVGIDGVVKVFFWSKLGIHV
jgi:heme/copper-type cytochrome/quinol oxidase subunit 3